MSKFSNLRIILVCISLMVLVFSIACGDLGLERLESKRNPLAITKPELGNGVADIEPSDSEPRITIPSKTVAKDNDTENEPSDSGAHKTVPTKPLAEHISAKGQPDQTETKVTCEIVDSKCLEKLYLLKGSVNTKYETLDARVFSSQGKGQLTIVKIGNGFGVITTDLRSNMSLYHFDQFISKNQIPGVSLEARFADKNFFHMFSSIFPDVLQQPAIAHQNIGIMFDENPENSKQSIAEEFAVYLGKDELKEVAQFQDSYSVSGFSTRVMGAVNRARNASRYYQDVFLRISGHGSPGTEAISNNQHQRRDISDYPQFLKLVLGDDYAPKNIRLELDTCSATVFAADEKGNKETTMSKITIALRTSYPSAKVSGRGSPFWVNYSARPGQRLIWRLVESTYDGQVFYKIGPADVIGVVGGQIYGSHKPVLGNPNHVEHTVSKKDGSKIGGHRHPSILKMVQLRYELIGKTDKKIALKSKCDNVKSVEDAKMLSEDELNFALLKSIDNLLNKYDEKKPVPVKGKKARRRVQPSNPEKQYRAHIEKFIELYDSDSKHDAIVHEKSIS